MLRYDEKYYVETLNDMRELAVFKTEKERQEWIEQNCYKNEDGWFLKETGEQIAIYDF